GRDLLLVQRLVADNAMPERFHPAQPVLWVLLGCSGATLRRDIEPAMRTRTDPGIFLRAPIDEIVPALASRPRMVGNFIGGKACARADVLRRVISARAVSSPGVRSLPAACSAAKGGSSSIVS